MHSPSVVSEAGDAPPRSTASRAVALVGLLAITIAVPLSLRVLNVWHGTTTLPATYLPSLEGPRERAAFDANRVTDLARANPGYVGIGDSMAGTRIDADRLSTRAGRPVALVLQAGSGSAFWYLALKNWVIASGIRPRAVFVFFRDTNLTDVLFRIDATWSLDTAALAREDDLNAVVARRRGTMFYTVRSAIDSAYTATEARRLVEPLVSEWPARALIPYRKPRAALLQALNDRFGLEHLRPMDAADMQATEDREADFGAYVDKSALPLMLRDAERAQVKLIFVRVQRRPIGGNPPYQSPALRRYVREL